MCVSMTAFTNPVSKCHCNLKMPGSVRALFPLKVNLDYVLTIACLEREGGREIFCDNRVSSSQATYYKKLCAEL